MAKVVGVVEYISQRGSAYNAKIDGNWYGCGFEKPPFKQGDTVEASTVQKGRYVNLEASTAKVVEDAPANTNTSTRSRGSSDQQSAINYQSARYAAIQLLDIAVQAGALPLPTKKEAKMDGLAALVDNFTERYFYDTQMVSEGRVDEVFGKSAEQAVADELDEEV